MRPISASPSPSASPLLRASAILFLSPLALLGATPAKKSPASSSSSTPAPTLAELTYSGDQSLLTALDRDLQLAGRDPAKLAALEKRVLAEFTRRDATFAARQALAQRLALILQAAPDPKSPAHRTFTALLADGRDTDLARLALQPIPGPAIDKLFLDALPKSAGRARIGLLDTIAVRRIAEAVDPLTPLLRDSDSAVAEAAARALGEIATPAALAALRSASDPARGRERERVDFAIHAARLAAATRLPATNALAEFRDLEQNPATPRPIRDAAFRTALDLDPAGATDALVAALASPDAPRRAVAAEAIATSSAPNLISTLAARLSTFEPATQAAVLSAFARRKDLTAVPSAVLQATAHADAAVRAAAITALGHLPGNRDIVTTLAKLAASDSTDDARLAKQSLARLNGPDVSAAIVAGAEQPDPALRPLYLEQLALRNQTEAIPLLFKTRTDPAATPAIRLAAVAALGDIAPLSAQSDLLAWTLAATDEAEQSRALRSFVNVALRDPDKSHRGQLLFETLEKSPPDVALRLLPALNRLGTARAAEAAARLASQDDATLAAAATAALARWTDTTALPALATVADRSATPAARDAARAAALRYFERNRDPWTPEFTTVISRLLKTTKDSSYRQQLLKLLHRADDPAARDIARSLINDSDPALVAAAKTAIDVMSVNKLGKPKLRASAAENNLGNILDGKTSTRWSVPAEGDEWLEIDFRTARPLHTITLDQTSRAAEFPEKYELYVTNDPKNPGAAVAAGKGQQNKTVIPLPPGTRGRYVLIKNVAERKDSQWSIVELHVD